MTDYQRIVAVLVSAAIICFVFELVRRRRLREEYALMWMAAGIVTLVFSLHGSLIMRLAGLLGIQHPAYAVFMLALFLGTVLAIHFTTVLSKLTGQIWRLTQEIGILQQRIQELESKGKSTIQARLQTATEQAHQRDSV